MRIIKTIYNKETKFICDIVNKFKEGNIVELLDSNNHKQGKKIRAIQTRFGSKNIPLIVFENENLEEVFAIWSEAKPDWEEEIKKYLECV